MLSTCLLLAPPLAAAEAVPATVTAQATAPAPSTIYVYTVHQGDLYLNRKHIGRMKALSKKPLEIPDVSPGDYTLTELVGRQDFIKCDLTVAAGADTYVYLNWDGCDVGHSLESLHYKPRDRTWLAVVITAGGLLVAAAIVGVVLFYAQNGPSQVPL
jgi:hypothetical protein